jgi:hypothetical protein
MSVRRLALMILRANPPPTRDPAAIDIPTAEDRAQDTGSPDPEREGREIPGELRLLE